MRHRLAPTLAAVAAVAMFASGCSEDRPDRALTVEASDEIDGADSSAGPDEEPGSAAGEVLTDDQAMAALLRVQDLPSGWSGQPNEPDDDTDDTIEPARCAAIMEALDVDDTEPVATAEATFNKGGPFGTQLFHEVGSFEEEYDPSALEAAAEAFGECPEFTSTDSEGVETTFSVSPMSFDNLGDSTLAVTLSGESDGFAFTLNFAVITIGHNLISIGNGGLTGGDGAELEELATIAVERLEAAAS